MFRPLVALLLLALPLAAAPVPKAVKAKASAVPKVLNTGTWVGANSGSVNTVYEYTFLDDGRFSATQNGRPYSGGTWKQDGETVTWEFNGHFSDFTVTYKEGKFEGSAVNRKGLTWNVTLTPKDAAEK